MLRTLVSRVRTQFCWMRIFSVLATVKSQAGTWVIALSIRLVSEHEVTAEVDMGPRSRDGPPCGEGDLMGRPFRRVVMGLGFQSWPKCFK